MKRWLLLVVGLLVVLGCTSSASRPASKKAPPDVSVASTSPSLGESIAGVNLAKSIYSELFGPPCSREKETGIVTSEHECPGVSGYRVIVTNVDDRASITVITPENRRVDLGLSRICKGGFCSVGQKAEWRVTDQSSRQVPVALIVRVNCQGMDGSAKSISYLAVSKITERDICLTDGVPPGRNANVHARVAADSSTAKPCLKT